MFLEEIPAAMWGRRVGRCCQSESREARLVALAVVPGEMVVVGKGGWWKGQSSTDAERWSLLNVEGVDNRTC